MAYPVSTWNTSPEELVYAPVNTTVPVPGSLTMSAPMPSGISLKMIAPVEPSTSIIYSFPLTLIALRVRSVFTAWLDSSGSSSRFHSFQDASISLNDIISRILLTSLSVTTPLLFTSALAMIPVISLNISISSLLTTPSFPRNCWLPRL